MKKTGYMDDGNITLLAKGVELKGEIKVDGTVRIDGRLEGEVHTKGEVIVGEDGVDGVGQANGKRLIRLVAPIAQHGHALQPRDVNDRYGLDARVGEHPLDQKDPPQQVENGRASSCEFGNRKGCDRGARQAAVHR